LLSRELQHGIVSKAMLENPSESQFFVCKDLKAKYFPYRMNLDAKLGRRPSYVWHGIWSVRDLLKEGLTWRLGNGVHINIWKDEWLPPNDLYF
jgi:hypothetical protein